jgi:hypothetical protein
VKDGERSVALNAQEILMLKQLLDSSFSFARTVAGLQDKIDPLAQKVAEEQNDKEGS